MSKAACRTIQVFNLGGIGAFRVKNLAGWGTAREIYALEDGTAILAILWDDGGRTVQPFYEVVGFWHPNYESIRAAEDPKKDFDQRVKKI